MEYLTSFGLWALLAWDNVKRIASEGKIMAANWSSVWERDVWLWEDGRTSLFAPLLTDDRLNCWHYDAIKNTLTLLENDEPVKQRRWCWTSGSLQIGEFAAIDFSDTLDNMKYICPIGSHPSINVVNSLLTNKIGVFIGPSAVYTVVPRSDPINELTFHADPKNGEVNEWLESWN